MQLSRGGSIGPGFVWCVQVYKRLCDVNDATNRPPAFFVWENVYVKPFQAIGRAAPGWNVAQTKRWLNWGKVWPGRDLRADFCGTFFRKRVASCFAVVYGPLIPNRKSPSELRSRQKKFHCPLFYLKGIANTFLRKESSERTRNPRKKYFFPLPGSLPLSLNSARRKSFTAPPLPHCHLRR